MSRFAWSSVPTNRLGVKVDCLGIVFRLERFITLLLHFLRSRGYGLFRQRSLGDAIRFVDFATGLIWRLGCVSSAGKGSQDGEGRQGQAYAYRSMGESLLVAAAVDGTEGELAMFFRAFLPRFLVILNGDLKKRAI